MFYFLRCKRTYPNFAGLRSHLKANHDHVRTGMNLKSQW